MKGKHLIGKLHPAFNTRFRPANPVQELITSEAVKFSPADSIATPAPKCEEPKNEPQTCGISLTSPQTPSSVNKLNQAQFIFGPQPRDDIVRETLAMVVLQDRSLSAADVADKCTGFDFIMLPSHSGRNLGYCILYFTSVDDLKEFQPTCIGADSVLSPSHASIQRITSWYHKELEEYRKRALQESVEMESSPVIIGGGCVATEVPRLPALMRVVKDGAPTYVLPNAVAKRIGSISGKKMVTEFVGQFAKVDSVWVHRNHVKFFDS